MPQGKAPLLVIGGPTASGKTRLAAKLALHHSGEVVSADSMQIYRGMEIGIAKPTPEGTLGTPHYLMGFVEPGQSFSVANYVTLAKETIMDIHSRGHLPVLAGGAGLYIRSLITNTAFTETGSGPALRAELTQRATQKGTGGLIQELRSFGPGSVDRIEPRNLPRLIRMIEPYRVVDVTVTEHLHRSRLAPSPYRMCFLCLGFRSRKRLYGRINRRVDEVLRCGLVEEAKELLKMPNGTTVMQVIGYKELLSYFCGEASLPKAQDTVKRETRHYAKRQFTWFHQEEQVRWLFVDNYAQRDTLRGVVEEIIRGGLYE